MVDNNYIIIDLGASNCRITRGSFDGKTIKLTPVYRFDNHPVTVLSSLYWNYLYIYSEIKKGILKASTGKAICSLAIDSWNIDFALIGKDGKIIFAPLHYRDKSRNDSILEVLYKQISREEIFKITGWNLFIMAPFFYLYFLKNKYGYIIENTSKFLMIPDLMNYFLTGEYFSEYSIASGSMMLNYIKGNWDKKIINVLGLQKDTFPVILESGKHASNLSKSVCKELDIKQMELVTCASHDTASAIVGIPITDKNKNWAFLSTGTWFILGAETAEKVITEDVLKCGFTNEGGVLGSTFLAKNLTGLWVIQECRRKWIKSGQEKLSWEDIEKQAILSKPKQLFIDIENSIFVEKNENMPDLISNFCIATRQAVSQSIGEISRCVFESLSLAVKQYLIELEKISGKKYEILHMIGGGVYNSFLCQLISNATGLAVFAGPAEAASVGNLIMQLKASGNINDLSEGREIIARSVEIIEYNPQDKTYWEEGYIKFKKIINSEH